MSERVARVVLQAVVTQYRQAMKDAAKDTEGLNVQVKETVPSAQESAKAIGDVGAKVSVAGGAMLAGFGVAVTAAAGFEKQMSGVKAVSNASAGEMKKLSDAALKAGADTVFSASEAAEAEAELAKVGISTSEILGGALTGSLSLAAAGQLDLAQAATISGQAMKIFDLHGKDVAHIADVLAAGANKSAADVGQLGDALRQGGLVASQTGLGLEETVGALAAFADNALIGSDAGTSLKTMLQRLTPQSEEAADLMQQLGIDAYDAAGNFVGLEKFAGSLKTGLSKLTDEQKASALATIFGSDAVRAAAILYDEGAAGIRDYIKAVDDQGAAARMAGTQMDNLAGDVEALKGSLETALIKGGSGSTGALRQMTQAATGAVNAYSSLPAPVQQVAVGLVGVTGAALATSGAVMMGIGQVRRFRTTLETAGVSARVTSAAVTGLSVAMKTLGIAAVAFVAVGLVDQLMKLSVSAPKLGKVNEELTNLAAGMQQASVAGIDLEDLGSKIEDLFHHDFMSGSHFGAKIETFFSPGLRQAKSDIGALDQTLASMVTGGNADEAAAAFETLHAAALKGGASQGEVNRAFAKYKDALAGARAETKQAALATDGLAGKIDAQAAASKKAADALRNQSNELKGLFDPVFAVQDALAKQAQAQHAVNEARKEHGRKSAEYKQAQDDALRATVDLDGAILNLEAGLKDGTVSLDTINRRLDSYVRAGLISAAQARRFKDELAKVADQTDATAHRLGLLGGQHPRPTVKVNNLDPTMNSLRSMERALASINGKTYTTRVRVIASGAGITVSGGSLMTIKAATGGYISGRGSGTSDSIPAWLSNGEFVVNAAQTARFRPLLEAINSGRLGSSTSNSTTQLVVNNPVAEKTTESLPRAMSYMQFVLGRG